MNQLLSLFLKSSIAGLLAVCLLWQSSPAQQTPPEIEWEKSLGGSYRDAAFSIEQTRDGGYIVAGSSQSPDGETAGAHGIVGFLHYWIVKLSNVGAIEWEKSLGGSSSDLATSIEQTNDGGYIVAGYSSSNDGDVAGGNHGFFDSWIVKLTSTGVIEWQKSLGGSNWDEAYSIAQTADSGYIVAGSSLSTDGDVSGNHGGKDYWIVKLTSGGEVAWQKSLGGSNWDIAYSIAQTADGGYVVAGESRSTDGDVTGHHGSANTTDYWIVKLTSGGEIAWQKSLGGSDFDGAGSITQTRDGGYIVAGSSLSNDGDVAGHHGSADTADFWIVKLTSAGGMEWQKSLGGSRADAAQFIEQTGDGGYIVAGWSESTDGDVSGNHGSDDYWIVKLTSTGVIDWQQSLGGGDLDMASSIQQTSDGGYIVAGVSESTDGDVTKPHGNSDYWIVKISPRISR